MTDDLNEPIPGDDDWEGPGDADAPSHVAARHFVFESEDELEDPSPAELADWDELATLRAERAELIARAENAEQRGDDWKQLHDEMREAAVRAAVGPETPRGGSVMLSPEERARIREEFHPDSPLLERRLLDALEESEKRADVLGIECDELEERAERAEGRARELARRLSWIHAYLTSECDWDELTDETSLEYEWVRIVADLLASDAIQPEPGKRPVVANNSFGTLPPDLHSDSERPKAGQVRRWRGHRWEWVDAPVVDSENQQ